MRGRLAVGNYSFCFQGCSCTEGGKIPKVQLQRRIEGFSRGEWASLLVSSGTGVLPVGDTRDDLESRAARAEALVQMGELSSARQALEGAASSRTGVVREERVSRRTFSCGIWTLWQRERRTNDGLKSSLKGCPFSTGAQLAIDTTLVSPLRADGEPHRQCHDTDGAALDAARRRKVRTFP